MKTIQNILSRFRQKIMGITYYDPPQTVKNDWMGDIENCIVYIEILDCGADEITYALKHAGFTVQKIGRELYIIQN